MLNQDTTDHPSIDLVSEVDASIRSLLGPGSGRWTSSGHLRAESLHPTSGEPGSCALCGEECPGSRIACDACEAEALEADSGLPER